MSTLAVTIEAFLLPFAELLRQRGHKVYAAANGVTTRAKCKEVFDGVWEMNWSRSPFNVMGPLRSLREIRRIVRNEKIDLVHVHTPIAAFAARLALRSTKVASGTKVLYTAHGFHFHSGNSFMRNAPIIALEKVASSWTDHMIVINREDFDAAQRLRLLPPEKISYFPGIGVDTEYYSRESVPAERIASFRRSIGVSENTEYFVMVAEFTKRKRHRDLMDAFAALSRQDTYLILAGVGPLFSSIQEYSKWLNIASRVVFLGSCEDVRPVLASAIAMILPSEREGLPRSIMESLSMEVPVIASNIRGSRDLLSDGGGILTEVGDIKGISNAMRWMLANSEKARLMGKRGRQRMHEFSLEKVERLHAKLYDQLLS
jgi:glycosyltransferase involved in cell wall biosynthesis